MNKNPIAAALIPFLLTLIGDATVTAGANALMPFDYIAHCLE